MIEQQHRTRVELAACFRLVAHFGMSELLIVTHISARVPGRDGELLIAPDGWPFDELRASDLITVDRTGASRRPAELAGHLAIHAARHDAACVIQTCSIAGMAVAAQRTGLLPLCQHAMKFHRRIGYHDDEGIVVSQDAPARLVRDLAHHQAMIRRNRGLCAVGRSIAEAFHVMYHLEQACRVQVAAMSGGGALALPPDSIAEHAARQYEAFPQPLGQREWPALLRRLDRLDPSYKT